LRRWSKNAKIAKLEKINRKQRLERLTVASGSFAKSPSAFGGENIARIVRVVGRFAELETLRK